MAALTIGMIRPRSAGSTIRAGGPVADSRPDTQTFVSITARINAAGVARGASCG